MKRKSIALFAAAAALSLAGALGAAAQESKQTVTMLLNMPLAGIDGKEANVVLFDVDADWNIASHFHPGHIFVYVLEGSIKIEVDGQPEQILAAGEVVYEIPNLNMVASNISSAEGAKILIFQVGDIGEPLTVMN